MLERANDLKQALRAFVLGAEGELAVALESFTAEHLARMAKSNYQGRNQTDLILDRFYSEGRIAAKSPIALFIEAQPDLASSDRSLLELWQRNFTGLFEVIQCLPEGWELMNWLTAKHYVVKSTEPASSEPFSRLKAGEIILTRIAPISESEWMFFSPLTVMGKLGKPKLAVAIGNFKQHYQEDLYSDAPELLEAAWQSVEQYHQEFLNFFGQEEVTLPGYQANQKLQAFQESVVQQRLAAAGIDSSKSFQELAEAAGVDQQAITETATALGTDSKTLEQLVSPQPQQGKPAMAMPKVQLPDTFKKAEYLTILAHPRWGQAFLPTYQQFKNLLEVQDWQQAESAQVESAEKLVRQYLENPEITAYTWNRLADQYPAQLEALLRETLKRPNFSLAEDLPALLKEFGKPLEPNLPEIASVPLHLHNLFQQAIREVQKSKPDSKQKPKSATGFRR